MTIMLRFDASHQTKRFERVCVGGDSEPFNYPVTQHSQIISIDP